MLEEPEEEIIEQKFEDTEEVSSDDSEDEDDTSDDEIRDAAEAFLTDISKPLI